MINEYFKWNQSGTLLLATPAGPYLSAMSEEMKIQGYNYWILRQRLQGAAHFSVWNRHQRRQLEQMHEGMIGEFQAHLDVCRGRRPLRLSSHHNGRMLDGAEALLDYLRRYGVITSLPPSSKIEPAPPALVAGFFDWMRHQRGTQEITLRRYGVVVGQILEGRGLDP